LFCDRIQTRLLVGTAFVSFFKVFSFLGFSLPPSSALSSLTLFCHSLFVIPFFASTRTTTLKFLKFLKMGLKCGWTALVIHIPAGGWKSRRVDGRTVFDFLTCYFLFSYMLMLFMSFISLQEAGNHEECNGGGWKSATRTHIHLCKSETPYPLGHKCFLRVMFSFK